MSAPRRNRLLFWLAAAVGFLPAPAWATQGHGAPEGIIAHQIAHLFFVVSLGVLIFWLRERGLTRQAGWRHIQYAALFLMLWNLETFAVHLLDEQLALVSVERLDIWHIRIRADVDFSGLELLYYFSKLDHLLCVPGLIFLYTGLKKLRDDRGHRSAGEQLP